MGHNTHSYTLTHIYIFLSTVINTISLYLISNMLDVADYKQFVGLIF